MKETEYNDHMLINPDWRSQNVKKIPLANISDDIVSQVRQAGLITAHVKMVAASIYRKGQQVPVTLEEIPEDERKTCHQYRLVDGNHRFLGLKHLAEAYPNDKSVPVLVDAIIMTFSSDAERLEYQTIANSRDLPFRISNINDALVVLKKLLDPAAEMELKEGVSLVYKEIKTLRSASNRKKTLSDNSKNLWEKSMRSVIDSYWPHFTEKDKLKVIKSFENKLPCNYHNYTPPMVTKEFKKWAVMAEEVVEKEKAKSGNFEGCRQYNLTKTSSVGALAAVFSNKTLTNNNSVVTLWANNPHGYNDARLDLERKNEVGNIVNWNNSKILKRNVELVDEIYIAPQKKTKGVQEVGFFKVPKNSDGSFNVDAIPTDGWKTNKKPKK